MLKLKIIPPKDRLLKNSQTNYMYSRLSLILPQRNWWLLLRSLTEMVAKCRSTVLQTAPVGAVCCTADLHFTAICKTNLLKTDLKCPV